ncbi:MAG: hypothetical protein NTX53_12220 [candidate division WOR-3 bacterium]|nr:hypothetical protein [candidate division WOR-3 bacterium]
MRTFPGRISPNWSGPELAVFARHLRALEDWHYDLVTEAARDCERELSRLYREGRIRDSHLLRSDVKARHDKMVEFTRRVMSDERGTMNAECDGLRPLMDAGAETRRSRWP